MIDVDTASSIAIRSVELAKPYEHDVDLHSFVHALALTGLWTGWSNRHRTVGWRHKSYEELCLELGEVVKAPLFVPDYLSSYWFERQQCYYNAWTVATCEPGWTYVEGYALLSTLPLSHAWLLSPDGDLVDPTWAQVDPEITDGVTPIYCGVRFGTDYIIQSGARYGCSSILASDWEYGSHRLRRGFIMHNGVVTDDAPETPGGHS